MVSSETAPTETSPESAKAETLSTSTEPTYDPFWIAPSVYCPGRDAENPPVCTEAMIQEFSHILGWKVMSVDAHIGHGVYNVVCHRKCLLSSLTLLLGLQSCHGRRRWA